MSNSCDHLQKHPAMIHRSLRAWSFQQFSYGGVRIKSNRRRKIQKFHNVDASLAALYSRHKRLISTKAFRDIGLGQASPFAPLHQKFP
jgi:hypothetical protein